MVVNTVMSMLGTGRHFPAVSAVLLNCPGARAATGRRRSLLHRLHTVPWSPASPAVCHAVQPGVGLLRCARVPCPAAWQAERWGVQCVVELSR